MKKIYTVLSLIGIAIWSATIFLRDTSLMDYDIIKRILWVAPNFGAVWAGVGLTYILYPYIFKKEFNTKKTTILVGVIFAILLASEIMHHFFLNSPFDIWDMFASAVASAIVLIIHYVSFSKGEGIRD